MQKVRIIDALICTIPFAVGAQSTAQAGFPDKPLWISNAKPVAGEEVSLYTVLYNGTDSAVSGTLTFLVDGTKLSPQDVSLAAQSSNVISAKWTAVAGTHSFTARFESGGGNASPQQTAAVQITVTEPPPPTALEQTVRSVSTIAAAAASTSLPIATDIASKVYVATEAFREKGLAYAQKYSAPSAGASSTRRGTVSGSTTTSSSNVGGFEPQQAGSIFDRMSQLSGTAIAFAFGSRTIFYPLLCLFLLALLYFLGRLVSRPRSTY